MSNPVHIHLRDVEVQGVNTQLRALSLKHFFMRQGKIGGSINIPILRGVSLDIKPGERVGIVGYNGSGKSSLLKVIAQIYPPHKGVVDVHGRVAPLIEMGVGFNPELTGRQNIELGMVYSGRISDLTPELEQKIVEFSELGEHIDRPYKGYSSGMQGRLSFSVSIFQKPDILLLDEVFATGDASFVEKSRQMMLSQMDTTPITIFVSHTSDLVRKICNRCIWMHQGVVRDDGDPANVLRDYESFA